MPFSVKSKIIFIIFVFFFVTQISFADELSCSSDKINVIDADTIDVCNRRIRLNGISAAERGHDTYGICKILVKDMINSYESVSCVLNGKKTYNREVGTCFVTKDNITFNLQELIVKNGCARDCKSYSGGIYGPFETKKSKNLPLPGYCMN